MDTVSVKEIIKEEKLVPILRTYEKEHILNIAKAVYDSGGKIIEFTMNNKEILDEVMKVRQKYPDLIIGIGTVLKNEDAVAAIEHGADFIVSPILNVQLIEVVKKMNRLVIVSGFTPTEIYLGHKAGSDFVKIFPGSEVEPNYVNELRGPLPDVEFFITGGLELISAIRFLTAGASIVGMGKPLFRPEYLKEKRYDEISLLLKNAIHRIKIMEI